MSNDRGYAGKVAIHAKSSMMKMILLSTSLFGLQFVWGVEQVYFMNYMIDIGMSKAWISLVWLAGPLSGLVVQPVVGALSDSCKSSYGRRRPFLAAGAVITAVCLFLVAWIHDIAYMIFPGDIAHALTISVVVIGVFLLDFAVNFVQAAGRALIVDSLSTDEQETGNAYASKLVASGHLLGYLLGFLDLRSVLFFLGDSNFKIVVFLSSAALLICVAITCRSVQERVLVHRGTKVHSAWSILKSIFTVFRTISPKIKMICIVQILSWHAWFPFLFYSSTWVGEVYASGKGDGEVDADTRSRMGSFALLSFSIVTLFCSFVLPKYAVAQTSDGSANWPRSGRPSLAQLWGFAQIIFGLAMCSAVLIQSVVGAFMIIAVCGFSWSLTTWAPFTLIGEEITKSANRSRRNSNLTPRSATTVMYTTVDDEDDDEEGDLDDVERATRPLRPTRTGVPLQNDDAGAVLGIHNIAICLPQFFITFISSIVFKVLEPEKGADGTTQKGQNAIGVVMAIGGGFALASGITIFRKLR